MKTNLHGNEVGQGSRSKVLHKIASAGVALGSLSVPHAAQASLVTGFDAAGPRTGYYDLQMGAGDLGFNGTTYVSDPAYEYRTDVTTGAGTQMMFGAALASGSLIDAHDSFAGGTETLHRQWQSGYMAYQPGYTSCGRYSCYSYPGYYYPVVTGNGTDGAWAGGPSGYLGFRFLDNGWHYGWVELSVSGSHFDIGNWAYETVADTGVVAGSNASLAREIPTQNVPEPGTLALLALGVAGLATFRSRRH